jgi:hypothetical protein
LQGAACDGCDVGQRAFRWHVREVDRVMQTAPLTAAVSSGCDLIVR